MKDADAFGRTRTVGSVILKLQQASESPRGYVKTQVTQSHAQNF